MDLTGIWNRELDAAEVALLYEQPFGLFLVPSYRRFFFQEALAKAVPRRRVVRAPRDGRQWTTW